MTGHDALFSALADPTRRSLFERLTSRGPATATVLANELPVSRQAIAKHLAALDDAGLVVRTRHGREVEYAARPESLGELTDWVDTVAGAWDRRIDRLRDRLG